MAARIARINKPVTRNISVIALLTVLPGVYLLQGESTLSSPVKNVHSRAEEESAHYTAAAGSDNRTALAALGAARTKQRLELPYPIVADTSIVSLPEHLSLNSLSEISEDLYTLQILGSHSREQVDRYLHGLPSQDEYAWFETRFRHQKWYVVVKGVFPDRQSAINAVQETREITGQTTWARSLGSIKQQVAAVYNK